MIDKKTVTSPEDELLEGGEVANLDPSKYRVEILREKVATTRKLAYILIGILAFSGIGHYGITVYLVVNGETEMMDVIKDAFSTWLPVISGLAGSAVTYFFTREK